MEKREVWEVSRRAEFPTISLRRRRIPTSIFRKKRCVGIGIRESAKSGTRGGERREEKGSESEEAKFRGWGKAQAVKMWG